MYNKQERYLQNLEIFEGFECTVWYLFDIVVAQVSKHQSVIKLRFKRNSTDG